MDVDIENAPLVSNSYVFWLDDLPFLASDRNKESSRSVQFLPHMSSSEAVGLIPKRS